MGGGLDESYAMRHTYIVIPRPGKFIPELDVPHAQRALARSPARQSTPLGRDLLPRLSLCFQPEHGAVGLAGFRKAVGHRQVITSVSGGGGASGIAVAS
jgi:hypothetical protein